ncbi:MAG: alpha/beta hydrolase [Acidimicrobiales bacterium]
MSPLPEPLPVELEVLRDELEAVDVEPEPSGWSGLTLPLGRRVDLPGRGRTFVREAGSPESPTTVLLVHGWLASGGLNWGPAFEPLGEHFRVVAPDLRGHGRGLRTRRRFRLEDCADDLAALVEELGCGPVIVVGYSMGGLIAQLLWRRRPDLVKGMVLCSTTLNFVPGKRERYVFGTAMNYGAGTIRVSRLATKLYLPFGLPTRRLRRRRPGSMRVWAAGELRRHDLRQVLEAGHASTQFNSQGWVGEIDVPAAVVVTTKDRAVAPDEQRRLASAISDATVFELDEDHTACANAKFPPVLLEACLDVAGRSEPS